MKEQRKYITQRRKYRIEIKHISSINKSINKCAQLIYYKRKIFNLTHKVRPDYMLITRDLCKTN